MTYLAIGCRALLGIVFVVAVIGKLRGPAAFAEFVASIQRMDVVRPRLVRPAAIAVVAAEIVTVLALSVPTPGAGVFAFGSAAALLAVLTTGIAMALAGGNREPCRCFGRSEAPLGRRHLGRNLALLAVAAVGLASSLSGTPVDRGVAVAVVVGGAVIGGLVVMLDDLVALA